MQVKNRLNKNLELSGLISPGPIPGNSIILSFLFVPDRIMTPTRYCTITQSTCSMSCDQQVTFLVQRDGIKIGSEGFMGRSITRKDSLNGFARCSLGKTFSRVYCRLSIFLPFHKGERQNKPCLKNALSDTLFNDITKHIKIATGNFPTRLRYSGNGTYQKTQRISGDSLKNSYALSVNSVNDLKNNNLDKSNRRRIIDNTVNRLLFCVNRNRFPGKERIKRYFILILLFCNIYILENIKEYFLMKGDSMTSVTSEKVPTGKAFSKCSCNTCKNVPNWEQELISWFEGADNATGKLVSCIGLALADVSRSVRSLESRVEELVVQGRDMDRHIEMAIKEKGKVDTVSVDTVSVDVTPPDVEVKVDMGDAAFGDCVTSMTVAAESIAAVSEKMVEGKAGMDKTLKSLEKVLSRAAGALEKLMVQKEEVPSKKVVKKKA